MPRAKTAKSTRISSRAARALAVGGNANQSANGHESEHESDSAVLKALSEISEEASERNERATKARAKAGTAPRAVKVASNEPATLDEVIALQGPKGRTLLNIAVLSAHRIQAGASRENAVDSVLALYRDAALRYLESVNDLPGRNAPSKWVAEQYPNRHRRFTSPFGLRGSAAGATREPVGPDDDEDEDEGDADGVDVDGGDLDGEGEGEGEGEHADAGSVDVGEWGAGADEPATGAADADTERSAPSDE